MGPPRSTARRPKVHSLFAGLIHFFRRYQHDRFGVYPAALADGERQRRGRHVVRNIENDISVDIAERVVERLYLAPETFDCFCRSRTTSRTALTGETLGPFGGVTRFHQILCHAHSPSARTRPRRRA